MAGIEPASERFAPRKSTSVAGWKWSRRAPQLAGTYPESAAGLSHA